MDLQDLGFFGITGCILLVFILVGFFKGLILTVLGLVCLSVAGYSVFQAYQHASLLIGSWAGIPQGWLSCLLAVITGLLTLMLCRYLLNFLVDPFNGSSTGQRIGFGPPAALIALVPGCLFLWLGLTGLRHAGSLAELQHTRHRLSAPGDDLSARREAVQYATPHLLWAKQALEQSSLGKWHQPMDPFYQPEKTKLCQILILYHHIPSREIMLGMPEFNTLLHQASFQELARKKQIKTASSSDYPGKLLSLEAVSEALGNRELLAALHRCDPQRILALTAE